MPSEVKRLQVGLFNREDEQGWVRRGEGLMKKGRGSKKQDDVGIGHDAGWHGVESTSQQRAPRPDREEHLGRLTMGQPTV